MQNNLPTDVIPKGDYCYTIKREPCEENGFKLETNRCPYWEMREDKPVQQNGYCRFLGRGDWEVEAPTDMPDGFPHSALSLIWDGVKECCENHYTDKEYEAMYGDDK